MPYDVPPTADLTRLTEDWVANVSQLVTLDRQILSSLVAELPPEKLGLILFRIGLVLGR